MSIFYFNLACGVQLTGKSKRQKRCTVKEEQRQLLSIRIVCGCAGFEYVESAWEGE